jgi:hypothetical protein
MIRRDDTPGMTPTRRSVLELTALLSAGALAGCLTASGPGAPETTDDADGTTGDADGTTDLPPATDGGSENGSGGTRPEGTGGPGVSIVATDDAPDLPVRPAVEVSREAATPDHPPQLRVTVTNTSERTISVGEGRAVLFAYVTDDSGALILLPAGREYPAEPDCWRLTEGIAITEEYRILDLEPGESVSQSLDLYGAAGGDACLPVGEFRFETTYSVVNEDAEPVENGQAKWGFSVTLE